MSRHDKGRPIPTNDIWIAGTYAGGLPWAVFVIVNGVSLVVGGLPAYRVLMVWVYDRTGSLLVAMLMHASLSACTFILGSPLVTGSALVAHGFTEAAAWWIVVAVVAAANRARVSREPVRRQAA